MAEHVHGPECEARAAEYRRESASALLGSFGEEKRDALLQAAHGAIDRTRNAFEGSDISEQALGLVMEVVGQILSQVMTTPVYLLSDTLIDSTSAYTVASAHLLASFELPERSEELVHLTNWQDFVQEHKGDTAVEVSDDFRPGNYL